MTVVFMQDWRDKQRALVALSLASARHPDVYGKRPVVVRPSPHQPYPPAA